MLPVKASRESGAFLQPEQLLHVAGKVGILPLGVKFRIVIFSEQRGRQSPAQQTQAQIRHTEGRKFLMQHGHQFNNALASRQAITEFLRGRERGGTRRQYA
jgi:hypothetical protein